MPQLTEEQIEALATRMREIAEQAAARTGLVPRWRRMPTQDRDCITNTLALATKLAMESERALWRNALMKACGDDEETARATAESQGCVW